MFRNPRTGETEALNERLGRPPTPPTTPHRTPFTLAVPPSVPAPKMAAVKSRTPIKQPPLPTIGRQGPTGRKPSAAAKLKSNSKTNGSILSFFKKADDDSLTEEALFVHGRAAWSGSVANVANTESSQTQANANDEAHDDWRYNEVVGSVKRRRRTLDENDQAASLFGESDEMETARVQDEGAEGGARLKRTRSGPFMEEDSDSERDEDENPEAILAVGTDDMTALQTSSHQDQVSGQNELVDRSSAPVPGELYEPHNSEHMNVFDGQLAVPIKLEDDSVEMTASVRPPAMIKEETSIGQDLDEFGDFDGLEDVDEDVYEDGDEFRERRYMEEQAQIESESTDSPCCPICEGSLAGLDESQTGLHVNQCLDGVPSKLPRMKLEVKEEPDGQAENAMDGVSGKRTPPGAQFRRAPRPPRPGQANPFILGQPTVSGGSAFNRLMSGHAEDAAWAEAAASEYAARGKPSYQRTCPFYKILPGLFICVDAFRYGAVAGCQAYFLSHFHSDHYVGLTSTWSHGPIYCSRVTANLVRQQLRVDPKYVIDLEFEQPIEVPGTRGVKVTMISANHCPGSSLYLFEKTVGQRSNGDPKVQRILHCGDFRACRMHLEHPLLMPSVKDSITGKLREQKIDVCYLDTTYLNPKYAFPSQELVIKACADMCVSLSKSTVDESDGWEQMKRQRAGEGMVKFVRRDSAKEGDIKEEPSDENEQSNHIKVEENPLASQQILSSIKSQQTRGRLLVIVGTYSIGKERICLGIARALKSKIYAPPSKQRIVAALEDPELNSLMTTDPRAAQVHMTPLFEIRADTLDDYLKDYYPHFTRAVGFRPSGWNYRPPNTRFLDSPSVQTVLNGDNWKSPYSMRDLIPQRGSTRRASCFGVPYSEHSSFRELTMFCCGLNIEKIIPTVNVGNAKSRERMKAWCDRWAQDRKKSGLWQLPADGSW